MGNLTVKESGEMINFISPNVNNITSFKVHFSPRQEGSGDPSPENVREITGWNGITATRSGKNLVEVSAETRVYSNSTSNNNFTEDNNIIIITGLSNGGYRASCKPNTQYTYSCEPTLKSGGVYLRVWEEIGEERNLIINQNVNSTKGAVATFTTGSDVYSLVVGFYVYSTAAQTGLTISDFQLELGSEVTSYEPYQETELNINWTNNIKQWIHTDSSFDTYSSNIFNGYANSLWNNAIENIPAEWFGKSLTYSVYINRAESPYTPYDDARVWFYGDSTTMKEASSAYRITEPSSSGRSWVTFTIPEGTTKLALGLLISKGGRAYNPQLEYGEEPTEYQPYVGDVYGGYVDLVSGELVSSWICSKIKDLDGTWYYKSGNTRFQIILQSNFAKTDSTGWSKFAIAEAYKKSTSNGYVNGQIATYNERYIYIRDDSFDGDVEAFLEAVGDTKVAYELAESTTYQLTPTQLSTLKGQNNFWSNADYIEIEYELTETFDIQKAKRKIILNQPHVESASGDLVTFDTDMKGKLKECKVYFSPVQEGEGDPSPDNVREITGWNGVEGYIINVAQSYSSTFNTSTAAIDWTNDVGTVYGGYVDLVSGELIVNMAIVNLGTLTWTYNEQYTTFLSYPIDLMSTSTYKKGLCSQYRITNQWLTSQGWASDDKIFSLRGQDGRIRIKDTTYTDASAFKTSVDGVQFIYELADPIHYQLTPQQLTALRGTNIIYFNANGQIDIKYWIHFPKINYMKDVQWLDHSYITSAGKLTEESTALSHTTVNSILLPAGNYRIYGFCYQEPPANSLNCRVHEYSAGGSWIKLITSNAANTMSPYILEFSLDHDSYIKLSLPRLLDAKLIKI